MIAYMDKMVGRLIEGLNELGLREDTLVLFYSDNGTHLKVSSVLNGKQVQGGKATPRQTGIRVPLIANWPGMIESSRTSLIWWTHPISFPPSPTWARVKIPEKAKSTGIASSRPCSINPAKKGNGVSSGTILGPVGTRIVFQDMFSPSIISTNYFRTEGSLIFAGKECGRPNSASRVSGRKLCKPKQSSIKAIDETMKGPVSKYALKVVDAFGNPL